MFDSKEKDVTTQITWGKLVLVVHGPEYSDDPSDNLGLRALGLSQCRNT